MKKQAQNASLTTPDTTTQAANIEAIQARDAATLAKRMQEALNPQPNPRRFTHAEMRRASFEMVSVYRHPTQAKDAIYSALGIVAGQMPGNPIIPVLDSIAQLFTDIEREAHTAGSFWNFATETAFLRH